MAICESWTKAVKITPSPQIASISSACLSPWNKFYWLQLMPEQSLLILMSKTSKPSPKFVICIEAHENDCLELRKIYQILPDEAAAKDGFLRVTDDSGEDYLYSEDQFVLVSFLPEIERAILKAA